MSIENQKTVEIYKLKASKYMETSLLHDKLDQEKAELKSKKLYEFLKSSFEILPKNSNVLEIGSADGSNAKYIENLGFRITASDIAEDFIKACKEKGLNTIEFNLLEDNFKEKYTGILAWRVFVHFTPDDILKALIKIYGNLENNGIFVFNVINRDTKNVDNEWIDFSNEYHMGAERYYNYYTENQINEIIKSTGFSILSFHEEGGDENNKWLVYTLKKNK